MRVLLLNSGGLDSAMIAKYLHGQGVEVWSLYVDTGAENRIQAMIAAQETADRYCANHFVATVDLGQSSSQVRADGFLYSIPASSLILSGVAVSYAMLNGILEIHLGSKQNTSSERLDLMNQMIDGTNMNYPRPHLNMLLRDSLSYAQNTDILGVDYSDLSYTHSCAHDAPCGACFRCTPRAELWTN